LRLQPDYVFAHVRLATLLRGKTRDVDLAALQALLTVPHLAPHSQWQLRFALAQVFDGRGEYARAAACLREANQLALAAAKGWRKYEPAEHEQFVDALARAFTPKLFRRLGGLGPQTRRPIFVFGLPRSGTTLVEQVLAAHAQVHAAGELRLCVRTFEILPQVLGVGSAAVDCIPELPEAVLRGLAEYYLEELRKLDGGRAARIVDKNLESYLYLGFLALLFPNATFIHCRRDLRDVAVSCWITEFRRIYWANDPVHIATRFQQYRRLMDHWQAVLPAPIHHVDYEEFVADLEGTARRLIATCGLEFEPACLAFHQVKRRVRTASVSQVRQPIYQTSVGRWKNYQSELADLFAALP